MAQHFFIAAIAALSLAASPALAQTSSQSSDHMTTHKHSMTGHGGGSKGASSSDHMADQLNGNELSSLQTGHGNMPAGTGMSPGAGSAAEPMHSSGSTQ
jgi:hypothetical protein